MNRLAEATPCWISVLSVASDFAAVAILLVALYGFVNGLRFMQAINFSLRRHWYILRHARGRSRRARPRLNMRLRRERLCATRAYMNRRVRGEALNVSDELIWLARSLGTGVDSGDRHTLTTLLRTMADPEGSTDVRESLAQLARNYEGYAMRINGRFLLRAVALPVVTAEHELATQAAKQLRLLASTTDILPPSGSDSPAATTRYEIPGAIPFDLAPVKVRTPQGTETRARRIAVAAWHRAGAGTALGYPSLTVEYVPLRWTSGTNELTQPDSHRTMRAVDPLPDALPNQLRTLPLPQAFWWTPTRPAPNPVGKSRNALLSYNGVLTALHIDRSDPLGPSGRGFREEFDPLSGRQRLHLLLSEVTFEAVKAFNYRTRGTHSDIEGAAPLLTLNLISLDRRGIAVLVERSGRLETHPHAFAGTVSGNAELVDRAGIQSDLSDIGLPDLLAATAREAGEEVGLAVPSGHRDLSPLGIHTVSSESERGTHVLTLVSTLEKSARAWVPDARASDPLEGAWELGDHLLTIDLKRICATPEERIAFFSWLKSETYLAPHAVGGLLMLALAQEGGDYGATLAQFASARIQRPDHLPDGVRLRRWRRGECSAGHCHWLG